MVNKSIHAPRVELADAERSDLAGFAIGSQVVMDGGYTII